MRKYREFAGTSQDLRFWGMHNGVVVDKETAVPTEEMVIVAATTLERATVLCQAYDAGLMCARLFETEAGGFACVFARDEAGYYF